MKSTLISVALFLITCTTVLNAQSINFENTKWSAALEKAKQENKMVYLDVFTDWCGPCKMMAKNYFPDPVVAAFYNKKFVNVSIDAEKGEGLAIAKQYNVTGYPTNLFIDPNTKKIIYKTMGAPSNKEGFIENGKVALDEKSDNLSLGNYTSTFKSNKYDEAFLVKYLSKTQRLDLPNDALLEAYLSRYAASKSDGELYSALHPHVKSINSKAFDLVLNSPKNDEDKESFTQNIMYQTVNTCINNKDEAKYKLAIAKFYKLYPAQGEEKLKYDQKFYNGIKHKTKALASNVALANFMNNKSASTLQQEDADMYVRITKSITQQLVSNNVPKEKQQELIAENLKKVGGGKNMASMQTAASLNDVAWKIFESQRSNKKLIKQALGWISKGLSLTEKSTANYCAFQDTYACLLYADGQKQKGIKVEEEALAQMEKLGEDIASYEETLAKMKSGKL